MADSNLRPTLNKPVNDQSKGYQKTFDKALTTSHVKLNEFEVNPQLNEIDGMLGEAEQSLKKKIFSLAKMEALVFSDPKLAAIYEEMSENGEEKYGYHYNETIQNMLFNDYVLNSPKYLQKYKQAVPKEKKRRDKSGINQLKKSGEDMQTRNLEPEKQKPVLTKEAELEEMSGTGGAGGGGAFSGSGQYSAPLGYAKKVDETTGSGSSGAYVGPAMWGSGDLMKTKGKAKVKTTPAMKGGTIIQESQNYLVESEGFEEFFNSLNEEDLSYQTKLADEFKKTHSKSNSGLGVSEVPQSAKRENLKKAADDNTSLYVGQDMDKMSNDDLKILHNDMTKEHSYFPHPENPNLPTDGISGKLKENRSGENNTIINDTSAFTSNTVKGWNNKDAGTEMNTIKTGDPDKANLKTMEENKSIDEKAVSKKQQKFMGMVHAVQKGELPADKVGGEVADAAKSMKPKDAEDFASTKHKGLPEKVKPKLKEEAQSMIGDSPDTMANKAVPIGTQSSNMDMGARSSGGGSMSESVNLLEEINNELKAFSIHQDKLKRMTEDRKPSSLVMIDRLGNDNQKNFKKDLKDSSVSKLVDIENELEYADQQTDVPENPYELGEKLEKGEVKATDAKSGEALKNVGDSTNDKGDEIPKRNLSKEEQDEVNLYRLGLGDYVYDNEVGKRFEDRMKADMGDKLYELRQKKLEFRGKAPMYNKDPQPTSATTADKVQFDKEQTGWNERMGLKEGMVTAKYRDNLGKNRIIDFNLNEVWELKTDKPTEFLKKMNFDGLGNTYTQKVSVNENVVKAMSGNQFFTNGVEVFVLKTPAKTLNESKQAGKPVINEQMEKMKHLVGYNTATFIKQSKL